MGDLVERLRLPDNREPMPKLRRPPRHKPGAKFLLGPIPWRWLEVAGRQGGKVLAVAVGLWFEAGCAKSRTVAAAPSTFRGLGVGRAALRNGLRTLERVGLVSVDRHSGRCARVTLLEPPEYGLPGYPVCDIL